MAHHLKTIGKQNEAISVYRQAIKIQPEHTESYWSMANLKTFSFDQEEIVDMENLLQTLICLKSEEFICIMLSV